MLRSGPGQPLTLTEYSTGLPKITWSPVIYVWVNIYLTTIVWPQYWSVFQLLLCRGNGNLVSTLVLLIKIEVYEFLWLLQRSSVWKYHKKKFWYLWKKQSFVTVEYITFNKKEDYRRSLDNIKKCTPSDVSINNRNNK